MSIYQIKVTLRNIDPPIWRRIQVQSDITLDKLHELLQIVMGWDNAHLHGFRVGRTHYGAADPLSDTVDERKTRLEQIVDPGGALIYEYDFGDSWEHQLKIEKVLEPEPGARYPVCLAGARACPLEDCGGFPGYERLLAALHDPENEEYAEMLEWIGTDFDPEAFDLDTVNARLGHGGAEPTPEAPVYADEELAALGPAALTLLMIRDEDRVPRNVIDACARHGDAMTHYLGELLSDDYYWSGASTRGEWWLLLHAVMILGLIPGERSGLLLVDFMQRLARAEDDGPEDWFAAYWPALLRNKSGGVLPALRALSADRNFDWFVRVQAVDSVVAFEQRGQILESTLDWAAGIAADAQEDWDLRLSVCNVLLDFPRARYRALLDDLAAQQSGWGVMFSPDDVDRSYAAMQDKPEWERFQDPWAFYSPAQIESRQQRWEREEQRAYNEDEPDEDAWEDAEPFLEPYVRPLPKLGRNEPCVCGSGKKYKKCCLAQGLT